jgi:hypothetical protein
MPPAAAAFNILVDDHDAYGSPAKLHRNQSNSTGIKAVMPSLLTWGQILRVNQPP